MNKEWLVSSAESRREASCVSSLERSIRQASCKSYGTNQSIGGGGGGGGEVTVPQINTTINGHLYDNISYAAADESPSSLMRSFNEKQQRQKTITNDGGGKFRLWLAAFVLLGITLANYSRNALSLASLGMLAKNAINLEIVDILSTTTTTTTTGNNSNQLLLRNSSSFVSAALDGSCPLHVGHELLTTAQRLSATPTTNTYHAHQLRASVKQRIESGDLVDWTLGEQGLISAAGSVGNLLIAIPLTRLGEIYGPKWIICAALTGATLQAALMPPVAAHCAVWLVMLFQLIFNGLTYGADCVAYTLFAHWLAPTELAFFVSCLIICYQLGAMLSSLITTQILSAGLAWSWCFYAPGKLGNLPFDNQ